jgi:hypothetical protein
MLLYLVKHSRPDISNAVWELSKNVRGATEAAFKELKRVIKFVLDTKTYGLKLEQKMDKKDANWTMTVFTDSDWAGDKEGRGSITGYIVFLIGAPILWKSKPQKSVSLSSSEAEYYALSEAAKEIKFVVQILLSKGIPVKIPVIVRVDGRNLHAGKRQCIVKDEACGYSISFRARICRRWIYPNCFCENCQ